MRELTKNTGFVPAVLILVSVVFMTAFYGCASIVSGGRQSISIMTRPQGANITIYDSHNVEVWSSQTPANVTLKRGDGYFQGAAYRIEVKKKGYSKKQFQITSTLNAGWYIVGNLFIGGWIGWLIVDPITGAMWNLTPKNVSIALKSENISYLLHGKTSNNSLTIVLREQINNELFKKLNPEKIY